MKILLITPFYRPGIGGSSRLLQDIADHIDGQGDRCDVLTYGDPSEPCNREFDRAQSYRVFRVRTGFGGASSAFMFLKLLRLLRSERYDRIFCGVAYPSAILGYLAFRLSGVPYFVYSHSEDVTCVRRAGKKRTLLARALTHARAVLVNSRFTRDEVRSLGVPEPRLALVPPGIDPSRFQQVLPERIERLRTRLHLQNKRVLLTLARLTPRKGHDTLIRALPALCARFPDLHYLIVGDGDPQTLLKLAAAEGVQDRVTIQNSVTEEELPVLFQMCDLYAMVSRWDPVTKEVEGFGIVYLEAAACGRPCVAGSHGGCSDAVLHGVTGFIVDPDSTEAVRCALDTLLSDAKLRACMGEAGQRRVMQQFDRKALLERTAEILLGP